MNELKRDYPWTETPVIAGAPMRLIALSSLATEISKAGGVGFVGAGSDVSNLAEQLEEVKKVQENSPDLSAVKHVLPVGIGFLIWAGEELLNKSLPIIEKYRPAAAWLFAPNKYSELVPWTKEIRRVSQGATKVWIQIGTVQEAIECTRACEPDVLVVQGQDAGGHGLEMCAGIIALFPEVEDAVSKLCQERKTKKPALIAAGGIMEGRSAAAVLALGASGFCLGTRYLAAPEANIAEGYRDAVISASDGGKNTARTKVYDQLRGTRDWPERYGGRGVLNQSYYDAINGMSTEKNQQLYDQALKEGDKGFTSNARLTTYAGTAVGLAREVKGAAAITEEVREDAKRILKRAGGKL